MWFEESGYVVLYSSNQTQPYLLTARAGDILTFEIDNFKEVKLFYDLKFIGFLSLQGKSCVWCFMPFYANQSKCKYCGSKGSIVGGKIERMQKWLEDTNNKIKISVKTVKETGLTVLIYYYQINNENTTN